MSPLLSLIDDQVLAANNMTYLDLKACVLNVTEYEKLPLLAGVILTCFLGHLNKYRLNIDGLAIGRKVFLKIVDYPN